MKYQKGFTLMEHKFTTLMVILSVGWILNTYQLYVAAQAKDMTLVMIRIVGAVFFPLGALLGYLPF